MKTPLRDLASQTFGFFHQERLKDVDQFFTDLRTMLENVCESPIEQLFLLDLLRYSQFYKIWIHKDEAGLPVLGFRTSGWGPGTGNFRVMIYPQRKINLDISITLSETKTYRTDFLIEVVEEMSMRVEEHVFSIVVELDGHDFHEKTKEQAQKDKDRDRSLTRAGYKIMRFTGSEVYLATKSQLNQTGDISETTQIAHQVMSMIENEVTERVRVRVQSRNV